jgi:hypothetical protein
VSTVAAAVVVTTAGSGSAFGGIGAAGVGGEGGPELVPGSVGAAVGRVMGRAGSGAAAEVLSTGYPAGRD